MLIFFIFQIFSTALKDFIKSFQPWCYSAKHQLFEAGKDWIPPTYLEKENNSSKNNSINNLTEGFCSLHDKLIILLNSLSH